MKLSLCIFISLCLLSRIIDCAKILFIYPVATRSESHLFFTLAEELALRKHEVTVVAPINASMKSDQLNMKQIIPTSYLMENDFFQDLFAERYRMKNNKYSYFFGFSPNFIFDNCHKTFQNMEFQQLVATLPSQNFDLVIMSGWFNDCFYGVIAKIDSPFILFTTMPTPQWITAYTGFHSPTSFVSIPILFQDAMSFWERLINFSVVWTYKILNQLLISPAMTELYRDYLGPDLPSVDDMVRNVSLIFSHAHPVLTYPRPNLPDTVEVAGMHCKVPKPLSKDIDVFLSGTKHGAIFFSLGSMVQSYTIPEKTRLIFRNVFARLKQRVLWKWDGEMRDLPSNVLLERWIPQQDVLSHKNLRLFITHGGLLSTVEAACHGVPQIALPVFVDQDFNTKRAEMNGYSITLELYDLTEEKFEQAISQILNDTKAKEISTTFRDEPQHPLDKAVFWVEYVLRHKGASHLRSASRSLNALQYHSLDVFVALIFFFTTVSATIIIVLCKICSICLHPSKSRKRK